MQSLTIYLFQISSVDQSLRQMAHLTHFLLISVLLFIAKSIGEMTDFTFTGEYTESSESYQINIRPTGRSARDFEFPEVCKFYSFLEEMRSSKEIDSIKFEVQNFESIQLQKKKVEEFLSIGEEIANTNIRIKAFSSVTVKVNTNADKQKIGAQLTLLKQQESELQKLRNTIQSLTQELDKMRDDQRYPQNKNHRLSQVNFEIQAVKNRLDLLQQLQRKSSSSGSDKIKLNIDDEFNDLNDILVQMNEVMNTKIQIKGSSTEKSDLQRKIAQLNENIKTIDTEITGTKDILNYKESKSVEQSKRTIQVLKLQKQQQKRMKTSSQYCEEVVIKVIKAVKNSLAAQNNTYRDQAKLAALEKERIEFLERKMQLQDKLKKYKNDEDEAGLNRDEVRVSAKLKERINQITGLSINEYQYSLTEITALIDKYQVELKKLQNQKRTLESTKEPSRPASNTRDFQRKVEELKALKARYCQKYAAYEAKATYIQIEFGKLKSSIVSIQSSRRTQQQQILKLKRLQARFEELREEVIDLIERNA